MRFAFLVVGATAAGALSVTAMQTMIPSIAPTFAAVRALGGNLADFKITDINPAKAYRDVVQKITSGEPQISLPKSPTVELRPISPDVFKPYKVDDKAIQRAIAAGISSQVDQNIRRMQDIQAYSRNPSAWHGAPPH